MVSPRASGTDMIFSDRSLIISERWRSERYMLFGALLVSLLRVPMGLKPLCAADVRAGS